MPLNFITHNNHKYPQWESEGNAARWIMPLAQYHCHGKGYDIGYSKEAWMLPGAIGIEPSIDPQWDAMKLPAGEVDYIFSSHCLEHVQRNWYDVVDYWLSKICTGGMLFLYLPHSKQTYWHPSSNRKHIHSFDGSEIEMYLNDLGHKVYVSGCDWNHSFVVVCEKTSSNTTIDNLAKSITNEQRKLIDGNWHIKQEKQGSIETARKETNITYDIASRRYGKHIDNDTPTGHYPVKDSLLTQFPDINTNDKRKSW